MRKEDEIAKSLGFNVKRTCEFNAYYWLVDENGFDKKNNKGERLCIEIGYCVNPGGKNSLPALWYRHGYTKEVMQNWWNVQTYVYDDRNNCYGGYNPTVKYNLEKKRSELDFDWVLPATPENFRKLLEQILYAFNY